MNIETIRAIVHETGFRLTGHASVEAMKDGISPADIRYAILHGKIVEQYPAREYSAIETCLIHVILPTKTPVHVIIDVVVKLSAVVVTVYIPDRNQWLASQVRKRNKGKRK